ncbi:MAG: chemotaxis protein CheW [Bryobacterales bacterium]|nr:chemotaxis protein CheW [Bryobacterales bacterium]
MHRPTASSPPGAYLIFRVGQYELALPHAAIRQIAPHPDTVAVPTSSPWLRGLLCGGVLTVPVLDTAMLLGVASEAERPAVIVVSNPSDDAAFGSVGLLVDRISDTARIPASEWKPLRASSALAFRSRIEGSWRGRSRPCYLLCLPTLIPADLDAQFSPFSLT